jgi:hypothetical protein
MKPTPMSEVNDIDWTNAAARRRAAARDLTADH